MAERFNHAVVSPQSVGIDSARVDVLLQRARIEVDSGHLPSCQVALARHGQLVAFECYGDTALTTRYLLGSAGRSVVAGVAWKLISDGLLEVNETVADIIPEFASNGKEGVLVEHVLTHTAGLPLAPMGYPKMLDREQRLNAFAGWHLTSTPGEQLQFHLTSAGWLIGEMVERRTGMTLAEYIRSQVALPLGLGLELGLPLERQEIDLAPFIMIDGSEINPNEIDPWNPMYLVAKPEVIAAAEPSHVVVATAADLALFYQGLTESGLWSTETIADATRVRISMPSMGDENYGGRSQPLKMGLFVLVAGEDGGPFHLPTTGSLRTFGHPGAPCQVGFLDPESGVSFAFLTNGYPKSGYDMSRHGRNLMINLGNLAADVIDS